MSDDIIEQAMIAAMQSPECYEQPKSKPLKKNVNTMGTHDGSILADTLKKQRAEEARDREEKRVNEMMGVK